MAHYITYEKGIRIQNCPFSKTNCPINTSELNTVYYFTSDFVYIYIYIYIWGVLSLISMYKGPTDVFKHKPFHYQRKDLFLVGKVCAEPATRLK